MLSLFQALWDVARTTFNFNMSKVTTWQTGKAYSYQVISFKSRLIAKTYHYINAHYNFGIWQTFFGRMIHIEFDFLSLA